MWPFKKKNTYFITWSYGQYQAEVGLKYTDYVKAHDIVSAWAKLKRQHAFPIYLLDIEKVE